MDKHLLILIFETHTETLRVDDPKEWIEKVIFDKNLLSILLNDKIIYTKCNS